MLDEKKIIIIINYFDCFRKRLMIWVRFFSFGRYCGAKGNQIVSAIFERNVRRRRFNLLAHN